jgi:hypothetical protein
MPASSATSMIILPFSTSNVFPSISMVAIV